VTPIKKKAPPFSRHLGRKGGGLKLRGGGLLQGERAKGGGGPKRDELRSQTRRQWHRLSNRQEIGNHQPVQNKKWKKHQIGGKKDW